MDLKVETAASRVGDRIRRIRTEKGLSQAELGALVGLNADRIQKYENGARKPKDDLLKQIAEALGVSVLALTDPVITNYMGAMFAMFELEHTFNMKIEKSQDKYTPGLCLSVDFKDGIYKYMEEWYKMYEQTQSRLEAALTEEDREAILKEYRMWQWSYPKALTDSSDKAIQKARIQEQIDKLQQLKDEIDSL